jgi:hypothetical protein
MNPHRDRRNAMNTHNVKTATPESPKTCVKPPSALWLDHKSDLLVALAKIEGELLMYQALDSIEANMDSDQIEDQYLCPQTAAEIVERLESMGAITTQPVLDMVCSVESLASYSEFWREIFSGALPALTVFTSRAAANRERFLASAAEGMKPFSVEVDGRIEYPEDDPIFGTYWQDGSICLGRAWTVAEAMDLAASAWLKDEWDPREEGQDYYDRDFGRDMGPLRFNPQTFVICDENHRRVLTGDVDSMTWHAHVTDPAELVRINAEQEALYTEAAIEGGWDNYETARQLRAKAGKLGAPIVDSAWMGHPEVAAAIASFVRPERKTWSARLNTHGLSPFMAADMTSLISLSDHTSQLSRRDRFEALHSVALSIAGHVSRSVTDWSLLRPKIPAAVISAWLLTREIVIEQFGESGEMVWKGIKGSLISHLNDNRPPF